MISVSYLTTGERKVGSYKSVGWKSKYGFWEKGKKCSSQEHLYALEGSIFNETMTNFIFSFSLYLDIETLRMCVGFENEEIKVNPNWIINERVIECSKHDVIVGFLR